MQGKKGKKKCWPHLIILYPENHQRLLLCSLWDLEVLKLARPSGMSSL